MRVPLTCAHELDVARHAHDQAPVRKAVNQLPAPTLILRSGNPGRDLALFDFSRARDSDPSASGVQVKDKGEKTPAAGCLWRTCTRAHRGGDGISRWAGQRRRACFSLLLADGADARDRHELEYCWHDDTR